MHCSALLCTVLYCTALNCTALRCNAMHCNALNCTILHCTALLHLLHAQVMMGGFPLIIQTEPLVKAKIEDKNLQPLIKDF